MTDKRPFLSIEERVEYLYHKQYFTRGSFTEDEVERLSLMNFHYFLGYAKNFRELYFSGKISSDKAPSSIFKIIDIDAQISELLYSGIRKSEWLLRHFLVQQYCTKFDPRGALLRADNLADFNEPYTNEHLITGLLNDILGYGESYVVTHIDEVAARSNYERPTRCTRENRNQCLEVTQDLPLWSVVDSFALGRLVKLIQRCDKSQDAEAWIWKNIAKDMDIPANRFHTGMDSLRWLRNVVYHQSRLWMRTTSYSPSKKGLFRAKLSQCHKNAMMLAFYNVASFQGKLDDRRIFAQRLEEILDINPDYKLGVS